jgi:hypothetical protein
MWIVVGGGWGPGLGPVRNSEGVRGACRELLDCFAVCARDDERDDGSGCSDEGCLEDVCLEEVCLEDECLEEERLGDD